MSKSKILILMSGSIASYKVCYLISALKKKNYEVKVVASPSALKFVGEASLEGLSGNAVHSDLWQKGSAMDHIYLERWADLILAAPATAHLINRMANGIGDDLLTSLFLAHQFNKPFLLAPAMNTSMYLNPATQASIEKLKEYGLQILESASGVLACGETGYGKLLEPDLLMAEIENALKTKTEPRQKVVSSTPASKILVTAGGTREPLDDVRYLANVSTGRTGEGIARMLAELGFDVTLDLAQSSPVVTQDIYQLHRFDSVQSLQDLLKSQLSQDYFDSVIHSAAVGDYTLEKFDGKLDSTESLTLQLKKTPKIINQIKSWSKNTNLHLVGFKLTSKLDRSKIDQKVKKLMDESHANTVVQNDIDQLKNRSQHQFQIYTTDGSQKPAQGLHGLMEVLVPMIGGLK